MKDHFTLVKLILNQRCEIKSIVNHKMSTFMSNCTLSLACVQNRMNSHLGQKYYSLMHL